MRLPEPFEFKYACKSATGFGLNSMTGNVEWASNFAMAIYNSANGYSGVGVAIIGTTTCSTAGINWLGYTTGEESSNAFRCVK